VASKKPSKKKKPGGGSQRGEERQVLPVRKKLRVYTHVLGLPNFFCWGLWGTAPETKCAGGKKKIKVLVKTVTGCLKGKTRINSQEEGTDQELVGGYTKVNTRSQCGKGGGGGPCQYCEIVYDPKTGKGPLDQ